MQPVLLAARTWPQGSTLPAANGAPWAGERGRGSRQGGEAPPVSCVTSAPRGLKGVRRVAARKAAKNSAGCFWGAEPGRAVAGARAGHASGPGGGLNALGHRDACACVCMSCTTAASMCVCLPDSPFCTAAASTSVPMYVCACVSAGDLSCSEHTCVCLQESPAFLHSCGEHVCIMCTHMFLSAGQPCLPPQLQ